VGVLVEAMSSVVRALEGRASLVLAGSADLSNRQFISELATSIRERDLGRYVTIKEDLADRELALEYERADVLVSPSLHEGLCVPVIEGYRAGCNVIGTDAGNLPYVVQPPDPLVPAGDPDALADAIITMGRLVLAGDNSIPTGAKDVIAQYSTENAQRELAAAVAELGPYGRSRPGASRASA
jgi:glycosyltransferase involved in cell wall biosynthesis